MKNKLVKTAREVVVYVISIAALMALFGLLMFARFSQSPQMRDITLHTSGILLNLEDEDFIESRNLYVNGSVFRQRFRVNASRIFSGTFVIDGFEFTSTEGLSFVVNFDEGSVTMPWHPADIVSPVSMSNNMGRIFTERNLQSGIILIYNNRETYSGGRAGIHTGLIFVYPAASRDEAVRILQEFNVRT